MAKKPAPHAHRVKLRNVATGQVYEAWPVDAREALNRGGIESVPADTPLKVVGTPGQPYEPPKAETPAPAATAATEPDKPARSLPEQLADWSFHDLQKLASRAGLQRAQPRADLVAQLVPLIEAKTVSLEELPQLVIPASQFPHAGA